MNKQIRILLFNFSGLLLLIGAGLQITSWVAAPWLFALGAAGIAITQLTVPYKDLDFRKRRLQRFNIMASFLMIAASVLMFKNRSEWVICLTVAAIFQVYTAFATPQKD